MNQGPIKLESEREESIKLPVDKKAKTLHHQPTPEQNVKSRKQY